VDARDKRGHDESNSKAVGIIAQQNNNNNKKVSGTFAHPALRQAIAMNAAPSHGAQVLNPRLRRRTFANCAGLARPYSAFKKQHRPWISQVEFY